MALLEATTDMVAFGGELRDAESQFVFEEALDWLRESKSSALRLDLARVAAVSKDIVSMLRVFASEIADAGRGLDLVVSDAVRKELSRACA
jgi:anti-anti-sigma regulatory factor